MSRSRAIIAVGKQDVKARSAISSNDGACLRTRRIGRLHAFPIEILEDRFDNQVVDGSISLCPEFR